MKYWKMPLEKREKYAEWKKKEREWYMQVLSTIKELTGLVATSLDANGSFSFQVEGMTKDELPDFLYMKKNGWIKPRQSTAKGKRIVRQFHKKQFPIIDKFRFTEHMFGKEQEALMYSFRVIKVEGQPVIVDPKYINLKKHGFEECEI